MLYVLCCSMWGGSTIEELPDGGNNSEFVSLHALQPPYIIGKAKPEKLSMVC